MDTVKPESVARMLRRRLEQSAQEHAAEIRSGAESPRLAGFAVAREGCGMAEAAEAIFGRGVVPFAQAEIDAVVATLDPDWRRHQAQRWACVADLDLSHPRTPEPGGGGTVLAH